MITYLIFSVVGYKINLSSNSQFFFFRDQFLNYNFCPQKPPDVGGDLIRLDSTPDLQDFDPLSSNSSNNNLTQIQNSNSGSLSNPIYNLYCPPNLNGTGNKLNPSETTGIKFSQSASNIPNGFGGSPNKQIDSSKNDLALLQEYGLDFSKFSICNKNVVSTNLQSNGTNKHWTTFD